MKRWHRRCVSKLWIAAIAGSLAAQSIFAQTIEKLDPAFEGLVSSKATVERVVSGFDKWTEGPVWTHTGVLFFAEIPANNIIEWRPGGKPAVFMHPSGYKGSAPFKGPEPGSNGMTVDSKDRLTVAGHAQRDVWRLESLNAKGQITILIAHRLSTIMHADRIYVLEKGDVVETGDHDSLINEKGLYYAMWRQQIGERKKEATNPN